MTHTDSQEASHDKPRGRPDTAVLVGFCTDKSDWISTLIRWVTWWKHSHVVLISPDRRKIIEATHGKGVVLGDLLEFVQRDGCELRQIPHPYPNYVWEAAVSQVGKPYDWRYALDWITRRDWQDPGAWACSELIAWAIDSVPEELRWRVSPRDIYLLTKPYQQP